MSPRIPTPSDFDSLKPHLTLTLHFPSPPESTTAILILFHGLGDSHEPFASFARSINLPNTLAIAVRAPSPVPPAMLYGEDEVAAATGPPQNFHWGDDLTLAPSKNGGEARLDPDPGFEKAEGLVMERHVRGVLVEKCGWEERDVLLFGFGQGGSFALGLASKLRAASRVVDITAGGAAEGRTQFKGVVSIGGPLPHSMIPSISGLGKAKTPVLLCTGSRSEEIDEESGESLEREFENVRFVKWRKGEDSMPASREEALPIMRFFAERLRSGLP